MKLGVVVVSIGVFVCGWAYYDQEAAVIVGNDNSREYSFGLARDEQMRQSNKGLPVPRIALCISGGGLRAMIGGLGFMQALDDLALLDCIYCICALSGSTWGVSSWLESRMSVAAYATYLKRQLQKGLLTDIVSENMVRELTKKVVSGQSISLDDIWGVLLAQKILVNLDKKHLTDITISNYRSGLIDGKVPLPIYTCVTPLVASAEGLRYEWVEWTPCAVRSSYLQTAIPLWSLGRHFQHGVSVDHLPVLSLSCAQGIWGSAMSGDIQDLLRDLQVTFTSEERTIVDIMHTIMHNTILDEMSQVRPLPASLPNWNYDFCDFPYCNQKALTFIDGAFLCNVPVVPALDPTRHIDIIIVVDLSLASDAALTLSYLERYAREHDFLFPVIDTSLLTKSCSVHKPAAGNQGPTLIYFPLIALTNYADGWDPQVATFTDTFNLTYTPEQFDLMYGIMYASCMNNKDVLESFIH